MGKHPACTCPADLNQTIRLGMAGRLDCAYHADPSARPAEPAPPALNQLDAIVAAAIRPDSHVWGEAVYRDLTGNPNPSF